MTPSARGSGAELLPCPSGTTSSNGDRGSGAGLQPRRGRGRRPARSGLREGDDAERQGDRRGGAAAVAGTGSNLEKLDDGPCGPFRGRTVTGQQDDGGAALLSRDLRGRAEGALDTVCHAPGELAARVRADLKLQAVEAGDAEHHDVLLALRAGRVVDVLLRRTAHFPRVVRAAAADGVVPAERARGRLESH